MPRFKSSPLPHRPQVDALRCFAVAPVLAAHFLLRAQTDTLVNAARLGVWLFFTISGFLITGILLRCRENEATVKGNLGRFYARRFLRIFPLYYGVLAFLVLMGLPGIRDDLPWLLTYTQNFYFIGDGVVVSGGHLWSLAVEEQFYLVWPLVILLTPRRFLLPTVVCITLLGPAWRVLVAVAGMTDKAIYLAPISALDTLGLGSVLAIGVHWYADGVAIWGRRLLAAGLAASVVALVAAIFDFDPRNFALDTAFTLLSGWVVYRAYEGFDGLPGRILTLRPLVYLGTISYGIYVLHGFATYFFAQIDLRMENTNLALYAFVLTAATIACAAVSWHLYEKPINNLKRYVPYEGVRTKSPPVTEGSA